MSVYIHADPCGFTKALSSKAGKGYQFAIKLPDGTIKVSDAYSASIVQDVAAEYRKAGHNVIGFRKVK